jgi:hypothetical protein
MNALIQLLEKLFFKLGYQFFIIYLLISSIEPAMKNPLVPGSMHLYVPGFIDKLDPWPFSFDVSIANKSKFSFE